MTEESIAWFADIDWGSERHRACPVDAQGHVVGEREFSHGGAGLADLSDWLVSICGTADTVAVGIEAPHGQVVDSLIDRGFVLRATNPKQLDRLRNRHSVAAAKDGRRDAYVLADGVRSGRRLFRRVHVSDPRLVELRAWTHLAEELTEERGRLFKQAVRQIGAFAYHFAMADIKPLRRNSGNQLHRATPKYRDLVKRKLHAYDVFIQAGIVCQGRLQFLAISSPQIVSWFWPLVLLPFHQGTGSCSSA